MTCFLTSYWADLERPRGPADDLNGRFGHYIFARNRRHALKLARQRGLGERLEGEVSKPVIYSIPSKLLAKRLRTRAQALDAIHSLTFLCHLALSSGVAKPYQITGDKGVLHDAIHSLCFGQPRRRALIARVQELEARVPGFLPIEGAE